MAQTVVGVNYIDTYHRSGLYPQPLPFTLGVEGVGLVEAVGMDVVDVAPGDRVGYASMLGAYAEVRLIAADRLVRLPDTVSDEDAAALLLRGMTVEYLIHRAVAVRGGDRVLFHAAAGGVGAIALPWLKSLGAIVIATAGSTSKCARAASLGADYVIDYRAEDWVARVREITDGAGVDVVYDGVGRDTCVSSMDCLRPRGTLVTFERVRSRAGHRTADTGRERIAPSHAPRAGALHRDEGRTRSVCSGRLRRRKKGVVKTMIGNRYPLANAAQAHRDIESRQTTGSVILTV